MNWKGFWLYIEKMIIFGYRIKEMNEIGLKIGIW